jgi:hypothetical protein
VIPSGAGLIASPRSAGGNVTGTTNLSFSGKQVELMRELAPRAVSSASYLNPSNSVHPGTSRKQWKRPQVQLQHRRRRGVPAGGLSNAFAMIRDMRPTGFW